MKKTWIVLFVMLTLVSGVFGQSFKIDKLYLGTLFIQSASGADKKDLPNEIGLYSGTKLKLKASDWFNLNSRTIFKDIDFDHKFSNYWATFDFDVVKVSAGNMHRPISLLKPEPVSDSGHFQTFTQTEIIGGDQGVMLEFNMEPISGDSVNIYLGIYRSKENKNVYDLNFGMKLDFNHSFFKDFSVVGYLQEYPQDHEPGKPGVKYVAYDDESSLFVTGAYGVAATLNTSHTSLTFHMANKEIWTGEWNEPLQKWYHYPDYSYYADYPWSTTGYKQARILSAVGIFNLSKKEKIDAYIDMVHAPEPGKTNSKWKRIEFGVWKSFSKKVWKFKFNNLICLGKVYSEHQEFQVSGKKSYINGYLQTSITL